jgi:hypothetical protein
VRTRILYVDDSGKPDAGHASKAVVLAGFAIDAEEYPTFSRRILGAKKAFHPARGLPQAWEIKSSDMIKPNPWNRAKNRKFCAEVLRLIKTSGGTAYSVTIVKANMNHAMTLATTTPLQLQALAEHFAAECQSLGRMGLIVADWSGHRYDQHASQCVASFVASGGMPLHPGVCYRSSRSIEGIQVADLIAGVRRRTVEGDGNLLQLDADLAKAKKLNNVVKTSKGRPYTNWIALI